MKILRWTLALVLAGVLVGAPVATRADDTLPPPEDDRWWGALGAVLCGVEITLVRTNPVVGMNPWALGAGIAGCGLALLDAST